MGGNKSGAVLLTIFVLTSARRRRVYHKARDWAPSKIISFIHGETQG